MATHWFSLIIALLFAQNICANNIQVTNARLTNQNTIDDFTMVEFDITWENSWRYNGGPANWDAAWIFVKYRVGANGPWQHASLNNTGHSSCNNTTIMNGLLKPGLTFHADTNPSLGVFLYRSTPGSGTFNCQDVHLRWNYGANDVNDNATVDIKVFAIEMVYIPQESFYVGSGGTESGAFYQYPTTTNPYFITSADAITVGASTDNLYYENTTGTAGDQMGPIPAAFPNGYNAHYAMKYELSQQSYADFLNTLTRTQQISRVATNISGLIVTNTFVMSNSIDPQWRNYIKCRIHIPPQPVPVKFLVDQNENYNGTDPDDGHNVACGYLSYADLAAYLDWAALRLMTELEFEKCGRGVEMPFPDEYAWGNTLFVPQLGITNLHTATEAPTDPEANVNWGGTNGPLRTGAFGRSNSLRINAGAGYYGCMELSSNLWEFCVTVGHNTGRSYTGNHGDGKVSTSGFHDVAMWPDSSSPFGAGLRGGNFLSTNEYARLSGRSKAAEVQFSRNHTYGGRGVRNAE